MSDSQTQENTAEQAVSTVMILRRPEVQQRCGLSTTSIYRLMKLGLFPLPIRLGQQAVGWLESDLLAWIDKNKGPVRATRRGPRKAKAAHT